MNDEVDDNESDYEILFPKIRSRPIFPVTQTATDLAEQYWNSSDD